MKDNPDANFEPKGQVQKKYWDNIKNIDLENKTPAVKDRMIQTAFDAISRAGYNLYSNQHSAYSGAKIGVFYNSDNPYNKRVRQKAQKEALSGLEKRTNLKKNAINQKEIMKYWKNFMMEMIFQKTSNIK